MMQGDGIERTVDLAACEQGRKCGSETEPLSGFSVIERKAGGSRPAFTAAVLLAIALTVVLFTFRLLQS
jgi:hypothetical protein